MIAQSIFQHISSEANAMTSSPFAAVANAIVHARRSHQPADARLFEGMLRTPEDAFAVQALVDRTLHGTDTLFPRFWKSGGPSRAAALTHAPLPSEGVWPSPAQARSWHFNLRLIEAEIAVRLARDVTPSEAAVMTEDETHGLADAMAVSIEVVDSRWQQAADAPALLRLADLQSHGALVLGEWVPFVARDWAAQRCTVQIGSQGTVERRGTHALGDPAWLLPSWLRHVTREGETVPAGTVVTTGTWCGMLPASAGDRVVVRFEGVGEASVLL
jgi:2-keto-4-pentenoate hydratase